VTPVPANNTQKPEPPKNATGPAPVQPPAPVNNTLKPEPPKNVTAPPAPVAPPKNDTKPVTPPAPVEPARNSTGPAPQSLAKPSTNTTAPPTNGSAPAPPKPAAPATNTTTKNTTDNKAPAKKSVDYTAYHKAAREDAKRDWKAARKQYDNNGDGRINFNEVLLAYARENGIYVDQIPKKVKNELRQQFDEMDLDGNGYIVEDEVIALYTALYEYMADQGVPLK
jgi:Ca2+-binding EF-hand superfamily protein